ncbi:RNA polymerase II C-terminal domain kinase beta subunit [Gonapodya sp. JEL0774]|nr:RNA polymerase II C-terminal domain kinase beta subunit [Gonapodya sp. JEL0774]
MQTPVTPQDTTLVTAMRFPLSSPQFHTQSFFSLHDLALHLDLNGILIQTESSIRKYAMDSIEKLARRLRLPWRTHATAKTIWNRFYASHPLTLNEVSPLDVAQVCLFVACKIEETMKKMKEIILEFGKMEGREFDENDADRLKPQYVNLERVVLETLGFDFRIFHPQKFVVKFCARLADQYSDPIYDWESIARMAWLIGSESYKSPASLIYPAHVIACSCIALSTRIHDRPLPPRADHPPSTSTTATPHPPHPPRIWCCQFFCGPEEMAECERVVAEAVVEGEEWREWRGVVEEVAMGGGGSGGVGGMGAMQGGQGQGGMGMGMGMGLGNTGSMGMGNMAMGMGNMGMGNHMGVAIGTLQDQGQGNGQIWDVGEGRHGHGQGQGHGGEGHGQGMVHSGTQGHHGGHGWN